MPRTLVMGVVNVTPDSFSDGGRYLDAGAANEHGLALLARGADLLDVGGESTRPGAPRPDAGGGLGRRRAGVRERARAGAHVSIDTMRAQVARAALDAGARIVNDVSGGLADPDMLDAVAAADAPYVLMHWRAHGEVMDAHATYDDVVADVRTELATRVEAALSAGIGADRLILDPGLGFAKDAEHNWALLAGVDEVAALGYPLLIGASRKRFLGAVMAGPDGAPVEPVDRDGATAAVSAYAALHGAWAVRVHDVPGSVAAVRVAEAIAAARRPSGAGQP